MADGSVVGTTEREHIRQGAINAATWEFEILAGIDRASRDEVAILTALVDAAERWWVDEHGEPSPWGRVEGILLWMINDAAPPRPPLAVDEVDDLDSELFHFIDWHNWPDREAGDAR
jgi:hypothetical protein